MSIESSVSSTKITLQLSNLKLKLGAYFEEVGDRDKAYEFYERAYVLAVIARDDILNAHSVYAVANAAIKIGGITEDYEEAISICRDAPPTIEKFAVGGRDVTGARGETYGTLHTDSYMIICRRLMRNGHADIAEELAIIADCAGKGVNYNTHYEDLVRIMETALLLGDVYEIQGKKEDAKSAYKRIINMPKNRPVPDFPYVRFLYAKALYMLCDCKKTIFNRNQFNNVVKIMNELIVNHSYNVKYREFYETLKEKGQI